MHYTRDLKDPAMSTFPFIRLLNIQVFANERSLVWGMPQGVVEVQFQLSWTVKLE